MLEVQVSHLKVKNQKMPLNIRAPEMVSLTHLVVMSTPGCSMEGDSFDRQFKVTVEALATFPSLSWFMSGSCT